MLTTQMQLIPIYPGQECGSVCSAMMENGGEEKDWRVGSGDECFLLTS